MPSLLPGYEYDIFISYRQKDNKYDGWVTEFVSNLKKELEATFKEDISIYFDENPHDGLLETHLVDKSLEGKLKCLVFIPIISQTYCDPKSFAWQHEFCAFNRLVAQDGHGRDIRVSNGNVASRILPIKIHDLDAEDQRTLESEIGGPLRAVEFIYKEPGVNRPLRPTDVRNENLTKTDYRNQVNKVANMVRELIGSIRNPKGHGQNGAAHDNVASSKRRRPKLVYTIALIVVFALSFLAYYVYKPTPDPQRRPRIAVLPFKQISETGETYFADGIKQVLVQHLQANEKLEVPPSLVATDRFRETTMTYQEIADELSADYLIDVSVKKWGDSIRLVTRLIDPVKDELRWQQDIKIVYARFFKIQEGMAASISESLGLTLSAPAQKKIQRVPTHSTEAYDYYLRAEDIVRQVHSGAKATDSLKNKVKVLLRLSIQADSNFVEPYPALAGNYFSKEPNDSLDWLLDKALSIDPTNPDALNLKSQSLFFHRQDTAGSMKLALRNIEANPYNTQPILWMGWLYHYWFRDDRELLGLQYYLQAYNVDPRAENIHEVLSNIGIFLFHFGDYARGETYLKRAIELQPKDFRTFDYLSNLYSRSGEYGKLLPFVKRMKVNFPNQADVTDIAIANLYLGDFEGGLAICKEYLKSGTESDIAAIYGSLLERTGDREKARELWQSKLKSLLEQGSSNHWRFARYYSKLGQNEQALTHIEQIQFTHTNTWANPDYLLNDYMLEPLRSEPRFIQKMKKEQDRLANVRSRLARMEQEKILVLPRLLPNP